MSTLKTFLTLFDEFINELENVFPDEASKLNAYKMKYETLKQTNPRKVLELFNSHVGPYASFIVNKDDSIIMDEKVQLFNDLGLKRFWTDRRCTDNTKEAIWAHLNTLYVFGNTINAIPQDLLSNIEKVAEQCAEGFEQNGNSNEMLLGMQRMLASQMKNINM